MRTRHTETASSMGEGSGRPRKPADTSLWAGSTWEGGEWDSGQGSVPMVLSAPLIHPWTCRLSANFLEGVLGSWALPPCCSILALSGLQLPLLVQTPTGLQPFPIFQKLVEILYRLRANPYPLSHFGDHFSFMDISLVLIQWFFGGRRGKRASSACHFCTYHLHTPHLCTHHT